MYDNGDKQAIYEALCRYCRSMDRMDRELALSVWGPDSQVHYHDIFEGSGPVFVDWVWEAHAAMQCHSHQLSNLLIAVNGDVAESEAYVTITLWTLPVEGEQQEIVVRGRYLDQWQRSEGGWRIARREHLVDTQSLQTLSSGFVSAASRRDENDPSYRLENLINQLTSVQRGKDG